TVNEPICGCSLASAFIVVRPVTRHGLPTPALEKQIRHLPPGLAYFDVSTYVGLIACSHGAFASPCGLTTSSERCRSYSARLKNWFAPVVPSAPALAASLAPLVPAFVLLHAASSATSAAAPTARRSLTDIVIFGSSPVSRDGS